MAARALWKGALKVSLVGIPIRVFAATDPSGEVSFRQIHRRCGTPIQLRKWCPHCDTEVTSDDITKGYEIRKGEFVLIEPEDIESVRPASTHTIDIDRVVDAADIDPMYIEKPYYVAPDNAGAGSAFAVMRDALENRAAVGKVALHGREYLVALRPRGQGLVMYTLRHGDEIRAMDGIGELSFADAKARPQELKLARQILDSFDHNPDLKEYHDDYEDALRQMIKEKAAGHEIVAPEPERPSNVVNLMDALRKSLAEVQAGQPSRRATGAAGPAVRARRPVKAHAKPARHARRHRAAS
jgi:Ku protein